MKIVWVIIFCLGLRLVALNQSLWLDEAISANVIKNYTYLKIVTKFSPADFHPPLYYLVLKTWVGIFESSEISLRMLSVVFSLITIYIVYLIGGIWPAILAGVNPLLLYYSQEARMYSMAVMLLTVCLYFFLKKKYLWFNVFAFLAFLTFYGSVFFLLSFSVLLLLKKEYKKMILINVGLIFAIMVLSPLLIDQVKNSKSLLVEVKNWSLVLGKVNLKNLLLIPVKFTSGRISFYPKIFYYTVAGIWAVVVFLKIKIRKYLAFFIVPLILGFVFSFFSPMLQYFRFLYLIPVLALMLGKQRLIAAGFLVFSLIYVLNPEFYREDWKSLANDLGENETVYMIETVADPIKYYRNDVVVKDLRSTLVGNQLTIIPFAVEVHGFDYQKTLEQKGYLKTSEGIYRELKIEKWGLN